MLTRAQYLEALEQDSASFVDIIASADLAREVPSCPGWTIRDLAMHVGSIHRWAHDVVVSGTSVDVPQGPADPPDLAPWFADGAAQLLDLLRTTDPDAPAWTFGPPPGLVSFWTRRQAHETAMHLADAHQALGIPTSIEALLASDGVDEVVSMVYPRQVRLGRAEPLIPGVRIVLDERPDVTYVLAGDGSDPEAPTGALIAGSAERVLLVLWGRASIEDLRIVGDPLVAQAAVRSAITS